jgi:hypothetical protein
VAPKRAITADKDKAKDTLSNQRQKSRKNMIFLRVGAKIIGEIEPEPS